MFLLNPYILGEEQIEWLNRCINKQTANFRIIVSGAPILNPSKAEKILSFAENEKQTLIGVTQKL